MIIEIVHILFDIVFIYLLVVVAYLVIVAVAGLASPAQIKKAEKLRRFAVLITTFKEDAVILDTVGSATGHDYPKKYFDVFVAADHLRKDTIEKLKKTGAFIYELNFEKSSKARSLNFLLNSINENSYDIALVLDGDNIMTPGLLHKLNNGLQASPVVQVHRTAKNMNNGFAVLDALSEEVNNHLFRKAQTNLGRSGSLIGSGMAFPFNLLKEIYNKPGILDNPACDREVDFELLVAGSKVLYLHNAKLLDEKVARKTVYENQRRRWLESQLMHIRLFFSDWSRVKIKSADFWNKLFINLLPPRLLLLAVFAIIFVVLVAGYLTGTYLTGIAPFYWFSLFFAYIVSILLAIPLRFYNLRTASAFLQLPMLFISFLKAALSIKSGRKEFIHTPKSYTEDSATTKHRQ